MSSNSIRIKTKDDLLAKYVPDRQLGQCWLWTGSISRKGYGHCSWRKKGYAAHRFVYEHIVGAIPEGLQLDHLCRVRHCVNPAHLEAVTCAENVRRGRSYFRERTHCPQGHAYDTTNTGINKNGSRYCRACGRERMYIRRHRNWQGGPWNGDKTHCPQGHPYDAANTHITKKGHRHCRACSRQKMRIRRAKRKQSA